jgi:hypothetical protein
MTPDERTVVLKAILKHAKADDEELQMICPSSWLAQRTALGGSDETIAHNWFRLPFESKVAIWLEAPDSDYEFAQMKTHILKGRYR